MLLYYFSFFFFKQKTAYEMRISDWSSDVCSSDLELLQRAVDGAALAEEVLPHQRDGDHRRDHGSVEPGPEEADPGDPGDHELREDERQQIGRASCRESVCQYG